MNLANFAKLPNFIHQTSYNSTTFVSILRFRQTLFAKLILLHFRQTFLPPNFCPIWTYMTLLLTVFMKFFVMLSYWYTG